MTEKTFGIRMGERNYPRNHYVMTDEVVDDNVIYEWLTASDYSPSKLRGNVEFPAPEGYLFFCGELVPVDSLNPEQLGALDNGGVVESTSEASSAYRHIEKVNTMVESLLEHVTPAEFYALGISEDRVLEFEID